MPIIVVPGPPDPVVVTVEPSGLVEKVVVGDAPVVADATSPAIIVNIAMPGDAAVVVDGSSPDIRVGVVMETDAPVRVDGTGKETVVEHAGATLHVTVDGDATVMVDATSAAVPGFVTGGDAPVVVDGTTPAVVPNFVIPPSDAPVTIDSTNESSQAIQLGLAIQTVSLPSAVLGVPYNTQIHVTGWPHWEVSVAEGELPTGLTLEKQGDIIVIYGTASGITETFTVLVTPTNVPFQYTVTPDTQVLTLSVAVAPIGEGITVLTPLVLPTCYTKEYFEQKLQATGQGPIAWELISDPEAIPPGLAWNEDESIINGHATPDAEGQHLLEFEVTDGVSEPVLVTFTLNVMSVGQIVVLTTSLPPARENEPYGPFQILFSGATGPVTATYFNFPAGISVSTSGWVSGTPRTGTNGNYPNAQVVGTHPPDLPGSHIFNFQVLPPLPMITVTSPLAGSVHAAGTQMTIAWSVTGLVTAPSWFLYVYDDDVQKLVIPITPTTVPPSGFNGNYGINFQIPITVPAGVQYNIIIRDDVTNGSNGTGNFEITAYTPLAISTAPTLPNGQQNVAYSTMLAGTGGVGTPQFALANGTSLPSGWDLEADGEVHGTHAGFGNFQFDAMYFDNVGLPAIKTFFVAITATGAIVITTGSLPPATVGVAWTPQQLAATGNSGPMTWSKVGGSADLTINSTGLVSLVTQGASGSLTITVRAEDGIVTAGEKTFTVLVLPSLGTSLLQFEFDDGTILSAPEGTNMDIFHGFTGNGTVTVNQPLDLSVGSINAPGGAPEGMHILVTDKDFDVLNNGYTDGLAPGVPAGGAGPGSPIYFRSCRAYYPGRTILFGTEFFGFTEDDPGWWTIVRPSDMKHPSRSLTATNPLSRYYKSLTSHMLDGGESLHVRFAPIADQWETSFAPSAQDIDDVYDVIEIKEARIAAWPRLDHLLKQYKHDPDTYANVNTPPYDRTITWLSKYAQWINSPYSGNPTYQFIQQAEALKNWYAGMCVPTAVDMQHNALRLGYYGTPAFMGVAYCREPNVTHAEKTLAFFLAYLERTISAGMMRYRSSISSIYKNRFRDEGTEGYFATPPGASAPQYFFGKSGYGGATMPVTCGKEMGDLALIIGFLLRGRGPNARPLIADAFTRRTAFLLSQTNTLYSGGSDSTANALNGMRSPGNFLRMLWWYYRVHRLLGNTATANQLRTNASNFIEKMFVMIDQSANSTAAMGVANKVHWPPITNAPNSSPLQGQSFPALGVAEGFFLWVTKWMSDDPAFSHVATNPTRLEHWKLCCHWEFFRNTRATANGTRELAYQRWPNMSGGGATWNGDPHVYTTQTAPNPNAPSYHGFFHAAWNMGMEPFMSAWFPGAVAPGGDTWAQSFDKLMKFAFGAPGYYNLDPAITGYFGVTGGPSGDIWMNKYTNILSHAALG